MDFSGKVALITGSSRGLGKAMALEFAKAGASVIVAARSETTGKLPGTIGETVTEIEALGGKADRGPRQRGARGGHRPSWQRHPWRHSGASTCW